MAKEMICTNCGFQGKPKTKVKGSGLVEIALWICFIVPGLFYTLWRSSSRYKACPKCKQPAMIPLDTPKARAMLDEKTAAANPEAQTETQG